MFLYFGDLYTKANTKHVSLDTLAADDDVVALEGLRELTVRRDQSVGRECLKLDSADVEYHANSLTKYLGLLAQLLTKLDEPQWEAKLSVGAAKAGFLWSSPLSMLPSTAHFSLGHLLLEQIMGNFFYAAALQEQAFGVCAALQAPPGEGGLGAAEEGGHVKAAGQFRRAAGIYQHIRLVLLPAAAQHVPGDPPVELSDAAAQLLETTALAQAQGVAAHRAESKGASPATVAAVHLGAASLFEQAAAAARGMASGRQPSERIRRYLAISAELHAAKAQRAFAGACMAEGEAGKAAACTRDAMARLRQCLVVADRDAEWKAPLTEELRRCEAVNAVYDKERIVVHVQPVPAAAPELPESKVVVAPVPWEEPLCTDHFFV